MTDASITAPGKDSRPSATLLPSGEKRARLRKWRYFKDGVSRYGVGAGGIGVVFALGLIFVYLFYEVFPLLVPADVSVETRYTVPGDREADTLFLTLERYQELGVRFSSQGVATFFQADDGHIRRQIALPIPEGVAITSFAHGEARQRLVAYGLSDGRAIVGRHAYDLSYPDDVRYITPKVEFPLGEAPVVVDPQGSAIIQIAIQEGPQGFVLAALTEDNRLLMSRVRSTTNLFTGAVDIRRDAFQLPSPPGNTRQILVSGDHRSLFVADDLGQLHYYDISTPTQARRVDSGQVVPEGHQITAMDFLVGTLSIIVGGSDGSVSQWFLVRDDRNQHHLTRVREFQSHAAPITVITPELARKGFYVGDASGVLGIHYATSHRTLLKRQVTDGPIRDIGLSPVNQAMLVRDDADNMLLLDLRNPHPQVSWQALWSRVWYEGRSQPEFIWQSSGATDDFEPKFSLIPVTLGTLKAAFFAMLFATPLAIMGAIYTAYFMQRHLRTVVKPTVEIMEALPTVILGFLAGLWLAPFIESHLPAVFSILILMPLAMLVAGFAWTRMPMSVRQYVPLGMEILILVPVILLVGWLSIAASPLMEVLFFGGSMRQWLTEVGITYDQRNALVVGIAMGFAVIPTIFSIAEDAVFNVPKHLTQGSLALGATPWQTVVGVVLPTASPGIFAAVMMGFGRAVGETMIVLMATGNSPVINFNIFEGMRTLSANIAVELTETAVGSTHYRILFFSALVLLILTFVVNTAAEIIRQRLRQRYSNL
ncbi:phosphate transport system permease protein [Ectothiorhodospira magna]|uniref:Phosphate transport system permease protein n=1 Tax=Ectothiorhodospira magna TaxID=867345 RepID=A0A1H9BHF7_9GAMM|nr:ABC transporter permease subunit [Ectothiorhodospira magna]SEP88053.1 phosphate transport system permease protein [Ectothiorhodospira magna]